MTKSNNNHNCKSRQDRARYLIDAGNDLYKKLGITDRQRSELFFGNSIGQFMLLPAYDGLSDQQLRDMDIDELYAIERHGQNEAPRIAKEAAKERIPFQKQKRREGWNEASQIFAGLGITALVGTALVNNFIIAIPYFSGPLLVIGFALCGLGILSSFWGRK